MPKHPLSFILCLLFSITFIAISPVQMAHADDLSQGMQLYRAKKYREAVPYLEKAAKEGHEEALKALDEIYADETPAVDLTDKAVWRQGLQSRAAEIDLFCDLVK